LGAGFTWVLALVAVVATGAIGWFAWRVTSLPWAIVLGMILGGAATHAGDRLFRDPGFAQGHVVDFIAYFDWFIGNVADIMIVAGAALAVVLVLMRVDTGREPAIAAPASGAGADDPDAPRD
jgi:signal peptidase II